jgi:hypothetical protein
MHDVLWRDHKVAGAAQRRTKDGLLIQGSIQMPDGAGLARARWEEAFHDVASADWGVTWAPLDVTPALRREVDRLAAGKYGDPAFLKRR